MRSGHLPRVLARFAHCFHQPLVEVHDQFVLAEPTFPCFGDPGLVLLGSWHAEAHQASATMYRHCCKRTLCHKLAHLHLELDGPTLAQPGKSPLLSLSQKLGQHCGEAGLASVWDGQSTQWRAFSFCFAPWKHDKTQDKNWGASTRAMEDSSLYISEKHLGLKPEAQRLIQEATRPLLQEGAACKFGQRLWQARPTQEIPTAPR